MISSTGNPANRLYGQEMHLPVNDVSDIEANLKDDHLIS